MAGLKNGHHYGNMTSFANGLLGVSSLLGSVL
jgi:hypothetical protein